MDTKKTFVVVDLETTGHSVEKGGRIIQIGMTFIKNRRVIDHFESFVNPGQKIDRNIQQLTHISQKEVKDAPYFEEIAPSLKNLLQDTVVIAHNINFDYPYLNDEFKRIGLPTLTNEAIDTVQLAQILLPTAPGYRLVDLTKYLNITLNHAHRANADAHATALLFLKLWQKAEELPAVVLQKLQEGNWPLLRETQAFLKCIRSKDNTQNKDNINQVFSPESSSIRRDNSVNLAAYPETTEDKIVKFGYWLTANEAQNQLMNRVHRFITKKSDGVLTVLTAPKIGKTLSYIMATMFKPCQRPILLLTNDISLQNQQLELVTKTAKLLDIQQHAVILCDETEYIDVDGFNERLLMDEPGQIQFLKARILVWLTQTQTGLLREIKVGNNDLDWLGGIRGTKNSVFFQKAKLSSCSADVLIMDFQSYFNQELNLRKERKLSKWPLIIMETPSYFVDDLTNYCTSQINLTVIKNSLKSLLNQDVQGLTHKQRLFIKQGAATALKLIKQIDINMTVNANIKRLLKLLMMIDNLSDVLTMSFEKMALPQEWRGLTQELVKLQRLQHKNDNTAELISEEKNGQLQRIYRIQQSAAAAYHERVTDNTHKLLVVSEYLDNHVSEFLRDVPKSMTSERDFIHDNSHPVRLIQIGKASPILHLQAVTQQNVGTIMMIVPDLDRANHWYQKLKYGITTGYSVVAEGITGSLEKIQRQSDLKQQQIMIVTPHLFTTMWLRNQDLPRIVIVPERNIWQPVSRLALVLTEMQRHESTILISQLNAMQRHRFKSQLQVLKNFDNKNNLIVQYNQILEKF